MNKETIDKIKEEARLLCDNLQKTDEVEQFDQQANALANIGLSQRKHACKLINDMFDLNVSVHLANEPYITDGNKYSKNAATISYVRARGGDDNGGEE